ncbi:probable serine/threonine-protein kinase nek2 [Hylaeus volcanicus]|uniref:probable serine/threonine-protein kinase nek2 n=1 Tax=Hylaeus volcanicus TaxID=313075 RepID=UPI0023B7EBA8|nr:probable serine/threonine-protein kinase nek2 [Hylaeus volcanicus]
MGEDCMIPAEQNSFTDLSGVNRSDSNVFEITNNLDDYEIIEDIGRGQFGMVQKIRFKKNPCKLLVWKKIKYYNMEDAEKRQLAQEVELLQSLWHTNIVRYVGKINDKSTACIYLIMEYCDGGDLGRYLSYTVKKGHYLPEELILSWFRQLVNALDYCHTRKTGKVLHRDLKPQNILLSGKYKKLKLADFGLAKVLQPLQQMAETHVGTPYYMSPEILCCSKYDEKSDIWSLGCLIYEISTGTSPFSRASCYEDLRHLVDEGYVGTVEFPTLYIKELFTVIRWMLSNDPNDRPTTSQLKSTILYKLASALRYRDVTDFLQTRIKSQNQELQQKNMFIKYLQSQLAMSYSHFSYIEEYVHFLMESDDIIKSNLKDLKNL